MSCPSHGAQMPPLQLDSVGTQAKNTGPVASRTVVNLGPLVLEVPAEELELPTPAEDVELEERVVPELVTGACDVEDDSVLEPVVVSGALSSTAGRHPASVQDPSQMRLARTANFNLGCNRLLPFSNSTRPPEARGGFGDQLDRE